MVAAGIWGASNEKSSNRLRRGNFAALWRLRLPALRVWKRQFEDGCRPEAVFARLAKIRKWPLTRDFGTQWYSLLLIDTQPLAAYSRPERGHEPRRSKLMACDSLLPLVMSLLGTLLDASKSRSPARVRPSRKLLRTSKKLWSCISRTYLYRTAPSRRSSPPSNCRREPVASDRLGSAGCEGTRQDRFRANKPARQSRQASKRGAQNRNCSNASRAGERNSAVHPATGAAVIGCVRATLVELRSDPARTGKDLFLSVTAINPGPVPGSRPRGMPRRPARLRRT